MRRNIRTTKISIALSLALTILAQGTPVPAQQSSDDPGQVSNSYQPAPGQRRRPLQRLRNKRRALQEAPVTQATPVDRRDINIPDIHNQPASTLAIPFDQSTVSGQALNLVLNKQVDEAKNLLQNAYAEDKRNRRVDPEIPYFLAAIEAHSERYPQALKYLTEMQGYCEKAGKCDMRTQLLLTKRIGDCNYKNHDLKAALAAYNGAFFLAQKQQGVPAVLISEILESIVGCETYLKEYDAAEKHCRTLIESTHAQVVGGGIPAVLSYSWAMLQLSEILRKAGRKQEFAVAQADAYKLLSQILQIRSMFDAAGQMPEYEELAKIFRLAYVQALDPKSPAEIAWAGNDFRIKTLPLIVWRPKGEPVAAIICIHGLGLENRSFTHTAKKLTERGYLVSALDVRGFGAWVQTKGEEELDYDQCLDDIKDVVSIVKKKNPNLPVYILGESMGGAIVLRAAAKLGTEISGVISSVPSAERFQQKRMSLQTAMHFIIDPKKPFDIGDYVAERATSMPEVRDQWAKDPKAKLDLSPVELMKFSVFMRTTKRHAEDIKDVPVLMLQGLKDRLVKPKGTFDLFEAVSCEDKSMIIKGLSEHLMFENPNADITVIDAVDSWLKQHSSAPVTPQAQ